jgi:CRP-like cAMP-binding protein
MDYPSAAELSACPFLHGMEWRHLELMAACALRARFDEGEVLFNTGEPANRFYLLTAGRVVLESERADGTRFIVQTLKAGDVLGWSWLFPPFQWRFTARAVEPVDAIFFHGIRLRETADQNPEFCCDILRRVSNVLLSRLQSTRDQLARAC